MNRWNIDVNFKRPHITLVGKLQPELTLTVIDHEKILDQIESKLESTNYTEAKDILQRFTK